MRLEERSDESLLRAFAEEKDEQALEVLVARHWERTFRVARRIVGDPHAADDVAQETFVKIAASAGTFERERAFAPWLYAITLNGAKNAARGAKRRAAHERAAARPAEAPAPGEELESRVEVQIAALPHELRAALVLRYGEELSLEEVAATLGCPVGTASSRIRRGLERLRDSAGVGVSALMAHWSHSTAGLPAAPGGGAIAARAARRTVLSLATKASSGLLVLALGALAIGLLAPALGVPKEAGSASAGAPAAALDSSATAVTSESLTGAVSGLSPVASVVSSGVGAASETASRPARGKGVSPEATFAGSVLSDADGQPIEDARIAAYTSDAGATDDPGEFRERVAIVRSQLDGHFKVPLGDATGALKLVVTAPGRPPLVQIVRESPVELRMAAHGLRLEGTIVFKGTSSPLADATVALEQASLTFEAETDASGRFVFADLAAGSATLKASGEGRCIPIERTVDVTAAMAPIAIEAEAGTTLTVNAVDLAGRPVRVVTQVASAGDPYGLRALENQKTGSTTVFHGLEASSGYRVTVGRLHRGGGLACVDVVFKDVTLAPNESKVLEAVIDASKDATVDVLATDSHGAPLPGATLTLRHAPRELAASFVGLGLAGTAGPDGHARFEAIPAGRYDVVLEDLAVSEPFELAEREVRSVTVARRGAGKLSGHVLDTGGKAIARAQVSLMLPGLTGATVWTDADGAFAFGGLPEPLDEKTSLDVFASGYEVVSLPLAPGLPPGGLDVRLEAEGPHELMHVLVKVADPASVRGLTTVAFVGDDGGTWSAFGTKLEATLSLPKGAHGRIAVSVKGWAAFFGPTVEAGKDTAVVFDLPHLPGRTLRGSVLDGSGQPIKDASVTFAGFLIAACDATGAFALGDLPAAPFEVSVVAPGFEEKKLVVDPDARVDVRLDRR